MPPNLHNFSAFFQCFSVFCKVLVQHSLTAEMETSLRSSSSSSGIVIYIEMKLLKHYVSDIHQNMVLPSAELRGRLRMQRNTCARSKIIVHSEFQVLDKFYRKTTPYCFVADLYRMSWTLERQTWTKQNPCLRTKLHQVPKLCRQSRVEKCEDQ